LLYVEIAAGAIEDTAGNDFAGISGNSTWNFTTAAALATPTVNLSVSSNTGTEAGTTAITVTATASSAVSGAQTVNLAVTGTGITAGDYTLSSSTITIPNGQTTGSVTFTIVDDALVEGSETAVLTISTPSAGITLGATTSQNIVITDNDVAITKIHGIQGNGDASALAGQTVTIEAIVVGDFQDGDSDTSRNLRGFYVQEENIDADGNALTSEGLFIFDGASPSVAVSRGDKVQITGTISEFFGETQLTPTTVTVISSGNSLPTAANITLPAAGTSLSQGGTPQPDLEAFEGMLVNFTDTLTINEMFQLDRFNEIKLVQGDRPQQFTQFNDPDVAGYAAHREEVGARTITYDDGLSVQNALIGNLDGFGPTFSTASDIRMGDTITGLSGVLSYQWAGNSASGATWRVRSTENGQNSFTKVNNRPATPDDVGGSLKVTGFNVLNYFKTIDLSGVNTVIGQDPRGADSADEFDRQTDKLITALLAIDADVLGLVELENDFSPGSSGNAIEYLVAQLNAATAPGTYAWVDPGTQFVGGDAIAVGLIYKPAAVSPVGNMAILDTPAFLDPNSTGQDRNRPAVAQTFEDVATGATFTAVVNHLKSKGASELTNTASPDYDQNDGQGFWNDTRTKAAQALVDWLNTDPTGSGDPDFLLLGDFNAYAQEDPIKVLEAAGYVDLAAQFSGGTATSYVFDGQTGTLDYAFASASLNQQVTGATEWGINSDEADAIDYNLDFGRDPAIADLNSPIRTSDHDPVLIGLNLVSSLPNGVASGDVDQDSAVLWTRSTTLGTVTFEYATDASFTTIVGSTTAAVTAADLPVKVEISGLTAGTEYFYRATDASGSHATGRFVTAAAAGTTAGLTFGVSGDWRGEVTPYPAIRNIPDRNLDFFVALGDTVYADDRSPILNKNQAETVEDFRLKHQEVYGDRFGANFWAAARASTSILSTIDDHEVTNNFQGGANAASDARFSETSGLINDTALFENGLQVYQEYNPLRDEFYNTPGNDLFDGERKLYRFNTYGNDAAVITLDTRSFRSQNLPAPNPADLNAVAVSYAASLLTPDRTLLGAVQLEQLKADLLAADAAGITWKFIMIPEPIQNILVGVNTDNYEGFAQERADLLRFIDESNIENVVFVAADIHITTVNNLTYQTGDLASEQKATSIFEITTGSVAYDAPSGVAFAQGIAALSLDPAAALAAYNSLPIAPDGDDLVNDKDDFVKTGFNSIYTRFPSAFDPIGLNNNLSQAEGLIDAELLQGDYFISHSYSWTEFDIDAQTQVLTVTTYGIDGYTEEDVDASNPNNRLDEILASEPTILSQFRVNPNVAPELAAQIFNLPEELTAGLVVGTISATDANTGHSEALVYSIDDPTGRFAVDAATGVITLVNATGLGSATEFTFNATVTDPTQLSATAPITVKLPFGFAPSATGSNGFLKAQTALSFEINIKAATKIKFASELVIFEVDDASGYVDGKAPGSSGYLDAILDKEKVLGSLSLLAGSEFDASGLPGGLNIYDFSQIIDLEASQSFGFLLVENGQLGDANAKVSFSHSSSFSVDNFSETGFELSFAGSDLEFSLEIAAKDDAPGLAKKRFGLQTGREFLELLDRRDEGGLTGQVRVFSEAAFDNLVGFYRTDTTGNILAGDGKTRLASVGDDNYFDVLIQQAQELAITLKSTTDSKFLFAGGTILSPFIIADGDFGNYSADRIFTPFRSVNRDGVDHFRLLGSTTFAVEDQVGGGDQDFDDMIIQVTFA